MRRRLIDEEQAAAVGRPQTAGGDLIRSHEASVLGLQRTAGNEATTVALQRLAVRAATSAGWPASIPVNGQTWTIESMSDGIVYRKTGVQNPHITIHGMTTADPHAWDGQYHVIMGGRGEKPYDYASGEEAFFMPKKKADAANWYRNRATAKTIGDDFYAAIKAALA